MGFAMLSPLEEVNAMVPCKKCGAPNHPTSGFCRGCGTALPATNVEMSPGAVTSPPPPAAARKKGNLVLKIIGILVAIFVGLVVFGAIIDASKNGEKGAAKAPEGGDGKPAATSVALSADELAKDGRLMCAEIQQQLTAYLKNAIKGIECQPGAMPDGMVSLVVAYPVPVLAKDDVVRKNTLFITFSLAGEAMAKRSNAMVEEVYVLDSSVTVFKVPGAFAKQMYTNMVSGQLSEKDARDQAAQRAQKTKLPPKRS